MKKLLFLLMASFSLFATTFAQNTANILVDNPDGTSVAYSSFEEAVNAAQANAFVYFPGASIRLPKDYNLTKPLHFRGTGMNSMKTMGGQTTKFGSVKDSELFITENASTSSFVGIVFNMQVVPVFTLQENNGKDFSLLFSSCHLNWTTYFKCLDGVQDQYNCTVNFNNCVLYNMSTDDNLLATVVITNSFLTGNNYWNFASWQATNCIFFDSSPSFNSSETVVTNCICKGYLDPLTNNSVVNAHNCLMCILSHSYNTDNLFNCKQQDWSNIFVNAGSSFEFGADYHLKEGSLAKGNGTNGSDMGVYDGTSPYNGGIPRNMPVVYEKEVQVSSDADGKLEATYKVTIQ